LAQATLAKSGLTYDPSKNTLTKNATSSDVLNQLKREDLLGKIQQRDTQQTLLNQMFPGGQGGQGQGGFGTMFSGISSSGKPTFKNDTPLDVVNRASGLRKEVISNPIVKDYQDISSRVSSLDSLLQKADSGDNASLGTLDQAIVTTFNKITDPNSVVRESEYARTPEGGSIIARFQGNVQKLQKGGAGLTPELRRQLVSDAKAIANGVGESYNKVISGYEDLASQYKVDPKMVLGSYKKHEPFNTGSNTQKSFESPEEADASGLKPGTVVMVKGRRYQI